MASQYSKQLSFTVLVHGEGEAHVAHCLETGLVASAPDEMDAVAKMTKLLDRQVKFALENDRLADIYHLAPKEIVNHFLNSERVISETRKPVIQKDVTKGFTLSQIAYATTC
jgi:hypothetical protein